MGAGWERDGSGAGSGAGGRFAPGRPGYNKVSQASRPAVRRRPQGARAFVFLFSVSDFSVSDFSDSVSEQFPFPIFSSL